MLKFKEYFTLRGIAACVFLIAAGVIAIMGIDPVRVMWVYSTGLYFAIAAELEYIRNKVS